MRIVVEIESAGRNRLAASVAAQFGVANMATPIRIDPSARGVTGKGIRQPNAMARGSVQRCAAPVGPSISGHSASRVPDSRATMTGMAAAHSSAVIRASELRKLQRPQTDPDHAFAFKAATAPTAALLTLGFMQRMSAMGANLPATRMPECMSSTNRNWGFTGARNLQENSD